MKRKLAICILAGVTAVSAAELYWIGGTGNVAKVLTPANWAFSDGTVSTAAPAKDDTLVFTNSVTKVQWDTVTVFDRIVLRGDSPSVTIVNTSGKTIYMPVRGLRNESTGGDLQFYRLYANSSSEEQIVDVVESGASVLETSHGYLDGTVVKRGKGTFRPYNTSSGNNLQATPACYAVEAGTLRFPHSKAPRLYGVPLKFRSCDSSARIVFGNVLSQNKYVLKSLLEENVSGHGHALADDSQSSTLTFTGAVENVTFSGRVCEKLSVAWKPDSEATLKLDGAVHTTTGSFSVQAGTLELTNGVQACSAPLKVASGAKVKIAAAGDWAWFKSVTIADGTAVTSGRFTADTADWLEGEGTLYVGNGAFTEETTAA